MSINSITHSFRYIAFVLSFAMFYSCSNNGIKQPFHTDTLNIIRNIFSSRSFYKFLPGEVDTIYILKNRYVSGFWPKKINEVHINYIENTTKAQVANVGDPIPDKRMRYAVPKLDIKGDSAIASLYNFNFAISFSYKLKQLNGNWEIDVVRVGMR